MHFLSQKNSIKALKPQKRIKVLMPTKDNHPVGLSLSWSNDSWWKDEAV